MHQIPFNGTYNSMEEWTYRLGGGLVFAMSLIVAGCSNEPQIDEGSWYDHSRDYSRRRGTYVDSQIDAGISELDAKKAWEGDQMIGNTLGSWREMSLHGDELYEIIDQP